MYDQGDQEDKEIAAEQTRAAELREELPDEDEESMPSPSTAEKVAGKLLYLHLTIVILG